MLFVGQEERRASDTVFFISENNDNRMTNQQASLERRNYFCLDEFWRVNLSMYIMMNDTRLRSKSFVLRRLTKIADMHGVTNSDRVVKGTWSR